MNKCLIILLFVPLYSLGQTYYPLHPVIGDTLDIIEKKDYSLFPKINNTDLKFCLIYPDSNDLRIKAYYHNDSIASFPLEHREIVEAQQIIEKVNAYYQTKDKPSNSYPESVVKKSKSSQSTSPLLLKKQMNEKAQKEARMQLRIEADKKRLKDHESGLRPNNINIEIR